jgi:hypothetical protein
MVIKQLKLQQREDDSKKSSLSSAPRIQPKLLIETKTIPIYQTNMQNLRRNPE